VNTTENALSYLLQLLHDQYALVLFGSAQGCTHHSLFLMNVVRFFSLLFSSLFQQSVFDFDTISGDHNTVERWAVLLAIDTVLSGDVDAVLMDVFDVNHGDVILNWVIYVWRSESESIVIWWF